MATSKFKIFIHRSIGILGCLVACLWVVRFFFIKEYVWAGIYSALTIYVLYSFIKELVNATAKNWGYVNIIICTIWPAWHEYSNYKRDLRLEKYGMVYNKTRESLSIPAIPAGWQIKYRGDKSGEWRGKQGILGHQEKYIAFDSLYQIEYERDEYNFKGMHDTSKSMSILFDYGRGKSKDSVFYLYSVKDTTLKISRHQADSIFDMAGIRKDY